MEEADLGRRPANWTPAGKIDGRCLGTPKTKIPDAKCAIGTLSVPIIGVIVAAIMSASRSVFARRWP
jgi:hypothetical protein